MTSVYLQETYNTLSVEQKYAFSKFAQGRNVFITGPGGTGKTRLIQFIVDHMNFHGKPHQVCAMTGCAAVLLNCKAKTIHSWSGIKLGRGETDDIVTRVVKNRCATKNWKGVEVLIVDEVSMMSRKMFDILDKIGSAMRKSARGKPFGGIQLVFIGDFFQLPPIAEYDDPTTGEFCFQHPRWTTAFNREDCVELKTMFRQTDPTYIQILQEIRRGEISEESIRHLEQRVATKPVDMEGIMPTKLFPVRSKVDYINETMYTKLSGEERVYHLQINTNVAVHIDSGSPLTYEELIRCRDLDKEQVAREVDTLAKSMLSDATVRLKIGTLVMCAANLDVERGICNGSQGVVVDFAEVNVGQAIVPVVRFSNGVVMRVAPHQRQSEEYPCISVAQIPLCLAWSMTIHKIQGATLDYAEMDIGRTIFAPGQSYVALSRVKSLDGLFLSEFNPAKIRSDPRVVEFYAGMLAPNLEGAVGLETMPSTSASAPTKVSVPTKASTTALKQTKITIVKRPNPFERFEAPDEMRAEAYEPTEKKKDPSIKTIRF
jgi:ATP-dependent DNA helicase PIF1